ncbi:MAG: hypothetical protein QM709_12400 [Spongiibacteraceae bacterium]
MMPDPIIERWNQVKTGRRQIKYPDTYILHYRFSGIGGAYFP